MSLDDDTSSASTLTLLDDYAFKSDLLTMMSDTGQETNDQLKRRAKAVLLEMGSTLTSVHEVKTFNILDAMMEGAEKAGLSSGVRYAAAAIIVAYQKGKASNSSASELTNSVVHDRTVKKAYRAANSPQLEISTPSLRASEVVADTVPATSRGSQFRDSISERDGNKCVLTGILNINKGPYPPGTEGSEGVLYAAHILRRSIVQEQSRNNRVAGMIDIIKHYTKLHEDIIDNLAGIIDNPENGMLLDATCHGGFDSYMWCLHPTDASHKYTVHWLRRVPLGMEAFTEVQFQDHSQSGIPLPNPTFIALHSAVAHVLHLSGAAEVIDKVYDAFSDDGFATPITNEPAGVRESIHILNGLSETRQVFAAKGLRRDNKGITNLE
ncbi:hypothetical protein CY34DRAFT_11271 [Suillus luteus UH-Slu-Lm8-n1]|uniref:HNH nuclease domain-containing protein n=1 Tax=Suillus luteus UH-Slu-Lm8-n1 TaxID=930992 RepID=A0A0D0BCV5_9AGAM|nr:hypothetical protein CY34DRAFT_11271 [Suillus luteus UH-Slu-Lm8-n1]